MTLRIPVVFDPLSRLVVEDATGSFHPFEAIAATDLPAGSLVYVYSNAGVATVAIASAVDNHPATGYVLETYVAGALACVYTGGLNKRMSKIQGLGTSLGNYTFTTADIGSTVYLDNFNAGLVTKIQPNTPVYQRVGEVFGVTDTELQIVFRPTINEAQENPIFKGTWDASANIPPIPAASSANLRWYYIVSTNGNTSISGISTWLAGDWILSNGTAWTRVENTSQLLLTTTETPTENGLTGDIGVSLNAAHADHAHATPATTLQTLLATSETPLADASVGVVGSSLKAARANHIHPKNTVKTPIRYFFESEVATVDKQPAMRIDGPATLAAIRYYSAVPGTGTIVVSRNGVGAATILLSSGDTSFMLQSGFTATPMVAGDIISIAVTSNGTAAGVTVQLDIEQYV